MSEKQTLCAHINVAAYTGEVNGTHLYDPNSGYGRGGRTEFCSSLEWALDALAEGGYVLDLRPLANHPNLRAWVSRAPSANGDIEGEEIDRCPQPVREIAAQMQYVLFDDFQRAATMMANSEGEPDDGSAGPFDCVSSAYLARYWGEKGARIGRREGDILSWNDGEKQVILTNEQLLANYRAKKEAERKSHE